MLLTILSILPARSQTPAPPSTKRKGSEVLPDDPLQPLDEPLAFVAFAALVGLAFIVLHLS